LFVIGVFFGLNYSSTLRSISTICVLEEMYICGIKNFEEMHIFKNQKINSVK